MVTDELLIATYDLTARGDELHGRYRRLVDALRDTAAKLDRASSPESVALAVMATYAILSTLLAQTRETLRIAEEALERISQQPYEKPPQDQKPPLN